MRAAERSFLPVPVARAGRVLATVLFSAGDVDGAATEAIRAATVARDCGAVLEVARALVVAGQADARTRRRDRALATELSEAEAIFSPSGAWRQRDLAARELRRPGIRRAGRADPKRRSPVDVLSRRERQVADLVAAGDSNREIAAALYISEKTVEAHVARIFAELGVTRRGRVAVVVQQSLTRL